MFDPFKLPKVSWRRLHNYRMLIANERARCTKCDHQIEAPSPGRWLGDPNPVCSEVDSSSLIVALQQKKWWGLVPEAHFEVQWAPYRVVTVSISKMIDEEKKGLTKVLLDDDALKV